MKRITSVEFCFENLETALVKASGLPIFSAEGISETTDRIAVNQIAAYDTVDRLVAEFYGPSVGEEIINKIADSEITSVVVNYDDGDSKEYYVPYETLTEELGAPNVHQKTYISTQGNLYLVIADDKDIEDYFDKEGINSEEYSEYMASFAKDLT